VVLDKGNSMAHKTASNTPKDKIVKDNLNAFGRMEKRLPANVVRDLKSIFLAKEKVNADR
jgi:hypothetical protein